MSSRAPLLLDCEKGPVDVYQTRAQLLAALKRRDAADAAFEAQVHTLLAPVKLRLAELTCDRGHALRVPHSHLAQVTHDPAIAPDLPPAPQIFYGRAQELATLVDTFAPPRQAHVALLGAAGAGTSALALAFLHRPEIISVFGARRFLVRRGDALATALGLNPHTPHLAVLAVLAACPLCTLIVLDDIQDDDLLAALSRMPRVSLLLTQRAPIDSSTRCFTTLPVGSLPLPAARTLFRAIADLPAGEDTDDDLNAPSSTFDVSPAPFRYASTPLGSGSDVALVDALLHHARLLPRAIVQLAQRAQYEPLPFLLACCVEECHSEI
ncbi:hypothetical protein B0H13DRAFT_2005682 [Mycena leptocephala]|nr:hypothetical protein B0H13DRAFT_2005682 [Mycena leptocephala]